MSSFQIGDKVQLTPRMRRAAADLFPGRCETGTVTRIGSWGVVDVQWSETGRPVSMRSDEKELVTE